jgi:hypothetical protein
MKVLNLQCAGMHNFEGWFGSEEDYQSQRERGLLACPLCADTEVRKLPSAPRLNLGAAEPRQSKPTSQESPSAATGAVTPSTNLPAKPTAETVASSLAQVHPEAAEMVLAEEARKIHYGESEERNIRGQASVEETKDLLEEGIDVLPLPVPDALKGGLQ